MNVLRFLLLFILFLGINSYIFSQEYNYTHYTVEDGLPSSEVYSTFQDAKGYIWFATDAGVSRFNGYEFKNFDVKDGLTDNTVFLIREDSKGRIWFGTFNKKLCYFYNDSIYPFEHNDKILKTIDGNAILNSLAIDKEGTVWMGYSTGEILKCSKNDGVELFYRDDVCNLQIFNFKKDLVWSFSRKKETKQILNNNLIIQVMIKNTKCGTVNVLDNQNSKVFIDVVSLKNKYLFLFLQNSYLFEFINSRLNLVQLNTGKIFNKNRLFSSIYLDNDVWLCVENEGVYITKIENNELVIKEQLLFDKKVSRVFKDNEGGYWFTTLDDGVFYLKSNDFKIHDYEVSYMAIDSIHKNIFLALKDKKIIKKSIEKKELIDKGITKNQEITQTLIYDYVSKSILMDGNRNELIRVNNNRVFTSIGGLLHSQTKSIIIDVNVIYRVNGFGISKIVNDKEVYNSYTDVEKKHWCTSLVKDKKNIWIGTNQGLVCFDDNTYKLSEPFKNDKFLSTGITCLEKLNNNIILIGTKSFGLLLMQNQKIIAVINEKNGLVSNLIKSIHVDNQNEIWIGSNKGLSRLHYISPEKYTIQNITTKHGLISNEISHIRSYKNTIFLVTPKNLIEFDKTKLIINKTPSPIYITKFKVNDVEQDLKKNLPIELSYNENRIDIHFESLNYKSLGEIDYQYRLLDLDTSWQNTTQTIAGFYGLPSGNYTFEVKAKNEDGFWSKPVSYSFKINPPFWFTWWFISLEVLMVMFTIIMVFKYRENQLRIKGENLQKIAENEKKIVELELKALRSQMNPHFIFNTLNSIQHFIANNNFKDTNRYISNFSKLIRMVLNHSEKSLVAIQEEVEMLTLYLDIEQVRFDNQFEYVFKIDEEIDLDYDKIPPMLLQPFVENAIWHGLMNTTQKGKIEIELVIEQECLWCSITDNGIGRKAAEKIKATRKIQNKSVGMSITKERLSIINTEKYMGMDIEIIDLFDNDNTPCGTKVIVKIGLQK